MQAEMQAHLEMQAEKNAAGGMNAEDARFAAKRQFGGLAQIQERVRDQRFGQWPSQTSQDLRYAMRGLLKHPNFTITAIATLALGIGVNTALFTSYNAVTLRSLPVNDPDGLVLLRRSGSKSWPRFSHEQYLAYRDGAKSLSGLVAWFEAPLTLDDETLGPPDSLYRSEARNGVSAGVFVQFVSENYFSVLGAPMELGRGLLPDENRAPQSHPVIVLSHRFWEQQLQRDPNVLGRTLSFSGIKLTVVGVTSAEFCGHEPAAPAGWSPYTMALTAEALANPKATPFCLFGRLQHGTTIDQARAELRVVAERFATPADFNHGRFVGPDLDPGLRFFNLALTPKVLAALAPIVLGFLLVLVIACTNVANLLFARGVMRQQEIGVRLSLGASRGRIVRQLLTENLLLCALGAAGGIVVSQFTLKLIATQFPMVWMGAAETRHWRALDTSVDQRVLAWTIGLTVFAALVAGLTPALHAARTNLLSALKAEPSLFGLRLSQSRMRHALVVLQLSISVALLSCAGLLARNLFALRNVDAGFDTRAVYRAYAGPKVAATNRVEIEAGLQQASEVARTLPGVSSACQIVTAPMLGQRGRPTVPVAVVTEGQSFDSASSPMRYAVVSPDYFATFGFGFLRGRAFTREEAEADSPGVVLTESAARKLWPEAGDVIGRSFSVGARAFSSTDKPGEKPRTCTVIGVMPDLRGVIFDDLSAYVFVPLRREHDTAGRLYVRPRTISAAAFAEMARQGETAGIRFQVEASLESQLAGQIAPFTIFAVLSGVLAGLALLMASVGLYGVMAFLVTQRGREISIRIALGASVERVVGLFVRQGLKLVAIGLTVGLIGGGLFAHAVRRTLYGLESAFDPVAFGVVSVAFLGVALLACWLPARKAAKVDPMNALRTE